MRFLLDTHILIWSANPDYPGADRLSEPALALITEPSNAVAFSVVSIWEVAIKFASGRAGFMIDPVPLRANLLAEGYDEVGVKGQHALVAGSLPPIHRDPFDRMLVAQAQVEGLTLLTADATLARYPGPIRLV